MIGQLGSIGGAPGSTANECCSLARPALDVAAYLVQMGLADHRPDKGRFLQRIAHADPFRALGEPSDEVGVNRALYENAGARRATFPVVGKDHEHSSIE